MHINSEKAMEALGAELARQLKPGDIVYLSGPLGAGKTTLVRGLLRALGYGGPVKSPTYTLLEPYEIEGGILCHVDLYRLNSPLEIENIGLSDYLDKKAKLLIEWPEQGRGYLPKPNFLYKIAILGNKREVTVEVYSNET
ncbi:MAG TPA: tRNA (adenosine(37)-N6)-threonylcarbamoyltransferase complex ATPase subunit type 1 TsaE [Coxiellaceae bacterium]|nr:tRNA (adenosine(37)-N6)-threonylcarbamoyltransferase complex ATPase subunit type 1 TsaE [Coxiellaceae bacterium]